MQPVGEDTSRASPQLQKQPLVCKTGARVPVACLPPRSQDSPGLSSSNLKGNKLCNASSGSVIHSRVGVREITSDPNIRNFG